MSKIFVAVLVLWAGVGRSFANGPLTEQLDRAAALFSAGDFAGAGREYQRATERDPGSVAAWRGLGWSLWRRGKQDRAIAIWNRVLLITPNDRSTLLSLADAYEQRREWKKALALYEQLLQRPAGKATRLRVTAQRPIAKRDAQDQMRALRGIAVCLWQLDDQKQALTIWNDLAKLYPDEPSILLSLAQAHEQRQEWAEALKSCNHLIKLGLVLREARLTRARVLRALDRYAEEEKELDTLLEEYPEDYDALLALAGVYKNTARPEDAKRTLLRIVDQQPDARVFRGLADADLMLGNYDDAARYYRRVLDDAPNDAGSLVGLARAYARDHRYAEAYQTLMTYTGSHPEEDQLRAELARYATAAGATDEAERDLRALAERHPDDPQWPLGLARLMHKLRRYDQAIEIAKQVLDKHADDEGALDLLANDALYDGREQEAIERLEKLVSVHPKTARFIQIGRLHSDRAERFTLQGDTQSAKAEYAAAASSFERGTELDPTDADARLGLVASLQKEGRYERAIQLAIALLREDPALLNARRVLYDIYFQIGDYAAAERELTLIQRDSPPNLRLEHERASLLFAEGKTREAIDLLERQLREPLSTSIPVLLYHGIAVSERENAMPLKNFRDQMVALKDAGYEPVSIDDVVGLLGDRAKLPPNPILITFDDARADSFELADPVLREVGFKAAMFVPVAEVGAHGAFTASWRTLREMQQTGRWDMQCHAYLAHRLIPVDAEGRRRGFLANRQWLPGEKRLETEDEFVSRIDRDYRLCKETLSREVPGSHVIAFAYPFNDLGQGTLSNLPSALRLNQEIAGKYFQVAFVQVPGDYVTRQKGHFNLPRFEVPRQYSGADLVKTLREGQPVISTLEHLGDFYAWSQRYDKALEIYAELGRRGGNPAATADRVAKVYEWRGDFAAARARLASAPSDELLTRRLADTMAMIDEHVRPTLELDAMSYADTDNRSNFGLGPSGSVHLNDRWSLSSRYTYAEYVQTDFPLDSFGVGSTGGSTASSAGAALAKGSGSQRSMLTIDPSHRLGRLQASGNQAEVDLAYMLDWSTGVTLSAGGAEFTNQSSADVPGGTRSFPVISGLFSYGIRDDLQLAAGGTHSYVGSAGAILEGLGYNAGTLRLQAKPWDWLRTSTRYAFTAYEDGNQRNTAVLSALAPIWEHPSLEAGYQFTFDDALHTSPFYYAPNGFTAHEAVASWRFKPRDWFEFDTLVTAGIGNERGAAPQPQASATGEARLDLRDDIGLFAKGGRSQAARFDSLQGVGGVSFRF